MAEPLVISAFVMNTASHILQGLWRRPEGHQIEFNSLDFWVDLAVDLTATRARVLHATYAPGFIERFPDIHDDFNVFFAGLPSITEHADMAAHIELGGEELERKLRALAAQESQTAGLIGAIGRARYAEWVSAESFRPARVMSKA